MNILRSLVLPLSALSLALGTAACNGHDDGDGSVIRLDDASEEVAATLQEAYNAGEAVTDDDLAAQLLTPEDGAELAAGSPPVFSWSPVGSTLRHGRTTGDFVWLHLDCAGSEGDLDVIAIESASWQPDTGSWDAVAAAGGTCEVLLVSAYVDRGIITEGPYVPSANPSFRISE
jgi:hypothetical protein